MTDQTLIQRLLAAYKAQGGPSSPIIISHSVPEAEARIATWEAIAADPDWDTVWPIMQILCLDFLAMAHLDRCRWGPSPANRSRSLAAWRCAMAAYPENMALRNTYLLVEGLPGDQTLPAAVLDAVAAGSHDRIDLKQPPTQRMAIGYPGEPLRAIQQP